MERDRGFKAFDDRVQFFQTHGRMPENKPAEPMVRLKVKSEDGRSYHVSFPLTQARQWVAVRA